MSATAPTGPVTLLADHTTLGLGGPAPRLLAATTSADVIDAVTTADREGEPVLLLAGGSNLVIADAGVPHRVVRVGTRGATAVTDGDDLLITVEAGHPFDELVAEFTADDWSGLEFLSGIPGSAGATPIQNVGAYGAEISQVLESVTVLDRITGQVRRMPTSELGLGYRHSILRGTDRVVVLTVELRLRRAGAPIRFGELATVLGVPAGGTAPPAQVREAVLGLRRGKGMVWDPADPDSRSAGSFFTNPVLTGDEALATDAAIRRRLGDEVTYPRYPDDAGGTKLSAAWLIERAGFTKGFALGDGARISGKHTLALTCTGGTTTDLLALAAHVRDGVADAFAVRLQPEPILVGVTLD